MEHSIFYWMGNTLFYILLFFLFTIISNFLFRLKYKSIDINNEISEKDNIAFSLVVLGYFIGILILFLGIIQGESYSYIKESILILSFGVIGVFLLLSSSYLNEKVVFKSQVILFKEIFKDENKGVGYVEAANFISSSLIIHGAISGKSINLFNNDNEILLHVSGLISLILVWIIGQLLISFFLKIYIKISKYDIVNQLEKDNVAVGIVFSGMLISVSILYANAVKGNINDIVSYVENVLYFLGFGVILFPISRLFLDKIILPKTNLVHEIVIQKIPNQGVALVEAFVYIASSILISFCI